MEMLERHYHAHPMIPMGNVRRTAQQIHYDSAKELYDFCCLHDLVDLWAYMTDAWYRPDRWYMWARSSLPDYIPVGKTTMMVEAHWKVLKRNFLYFHHRARLDLLVYVLTTKQYEQQRYRWERLIVHRIDTSDWEKDFVQEWNTVCGRTESPDADQLYCPDINQWICGCPAYAKSRFPLCKLLVNRSGYGQFALRKRRVVRNLVPPFVCITSSDGMAIQQTDPIPVSQLTQGPDVAIPRLEEEVFIADEEQRQLFGRALALRDGLTAELAEMPNVGKLRSLLQSLAPFEVRSAAMATYQRRRTLPSRQEMNSATRYIN